MEEMLPILDEQHRQIGEAPRSLCHDAKSFLLHPVVHLHIFRDGKLLLQKRSESKRIQPGRWDTCVGGHVSAGEPLEVALIREAAEEIGFDASNAKFLKSYKFQSAVERELINIYLAEVASDFSISVSNEEVTEVRFWDVNEVLKPENEHLFTPNLLLELKEHILLQL